MANNYVLNYVKRSTSAFRESASTRTEDFFDLAFGGRIKEMYLEEFGIIIVGHAIDDFLPFFSFLNRRLPLLSVTPKPKSIDPHVLALIENEATVMVLQREEQKDLEEILLLLERKLGDRKIILVDIGGYFAPLLRPLSDHIGKQLAGVVEDTQNGHQRYEALSHLPCPVVSVAKSELKAAEEFMVSLNIVETAEEILGRQFSHSANERISIIGFGRIGKDIARVLSYKGIVPAIFDTDPIKLSCAPTSAVNILPRSKLIEKSDVIFCATGNKSLSVCDFSNTKDGLVVVSVTSSDDEFSFEGLHDAYTVEVMSSTMSRLHLGHGKLAYLVNHGNAANFASDPCVGAFIALLQAEMIEAMLQIMEKKITEAKIQSIDPASTREIARAWVKSFHSIDV